MYLEVRSRLQRFSSAHGSGFCVIERQQECFVRQQIALACSQPLQEAAVQTIKLRFHVPLLLQQRPVAPQYSEMPTQQITNSN
jgi:hypothetical protein